jgi:FkbM family methyltransferase
MRRTIVILSVGVNSILNYRERGSFSLFPERGVAAAGTGHTRRHRLLSDMLNALRHVWRHPLNKEAPLSGLERFLRWQIATRLLPDAQVAVPFTDRARLLISRGMYGATQNVYCGLNDFPEMSLLLHYLREGDVFLDAGANVGAYTVLASAGAGAETYAFEPSPKAMDTLRSNVELNRIAARVHLEPYALGRAAGAILLQTSGPSAMHHVAATSSQGPSPAGRDSVEVRTVDSYRLCPSIIKIDVEGYEAEVLAGAVETAACPELVAIITENSDDSGLYGEGILNVSAFMNQHGFVPVTYDPWRREIQADQPRSDNTIYVRDVERVRQRVRDAEPFRVFGRSV